MPPNDIEEFDVEMEMLLNEIPHVTSPLYDHNAQSSPLSPGNAMHGHGDDVTGLFNRFDSMYISDKPNNPFSIQSDFDPFNGDFDEIQNLGFSPNSLKNNGFDPYWDSNALDLSTGSISPVEGLNCSYRKRKGVIDGSLYGVIYDNMIGSRGIVNVLARDQKGCRLLQGKFDEGKQHVDLIFDGVIEHVDELMKDPFGNYLMQKLFDVCSEEQKNAIILVLTEDPATIFRISVDSHGTRSMQKLIETLKTHNQIAVVMAALKPGLIDLIKDIHGNHVIQHCLTFLKIEDTKFIFDAATRHCIDIATYRHGCCVLQHCISNSVGDHRASLVAKVSNDGLLLAQDEFGNYVIQYIISLKSPSANANLASQFEGNYVRLAMQKCSSNVVEKCFKEFGDDLKATIVFELLEASQFQRLLQHPFGNYVIQSALSNTKLSTRLGASRTALVAAIRPHIALLRTSPYCKRILALLPKKKSSTS